MSTRTTTALICAGWLMAAPSVHAGQCPALTPPAQISAAMVSTTWFDQRPAFAGDGAGHWLVVWHGTTPGETLGGDSDILFAHSADNGATWSAVAPVNSDAATDATFDDDPSIATDGLGTWMVVWTSALEGGGDSDIFYAVSVDHGATWTDPAVVDASAPGDSRTDYEPQVAIDGTGRWGVVWISRDPAGDALGTDRDLFFAASVDDGQNWAAPQVVNTNAADDTGQDTEPRIAADDAQGWMVVWSSTDDLRGTLGTDQDVLHAFSPDGGASWSAPAAVDITAADDQYADRWPRLATDGQGVWLVTWNDSFSAAVFTRSFDDGATWDRPRLLDNQPVPGAGSQRPVPIAALGDGLWLAAWEYFVSGWETQGADASPPLLGAEFDIVQATSSDDGETWTAIAPANTDAALTPSDHYQPQLACGSSGHCLIGWWTAMTSGGISYVFDHTRLVLPDCNRNGVADEDDIAVGDSADADRDGVPDECATDTDGDGTFDGCDNCVLFNPDQADCLYDGVGDLCAIDSGASADCDGNSVPDTCQLDCDGDGVPNACAQCAGYDIIDLGGASEDDIRAHAINALGRVVGYVATPGEVYGFVWHDGRMTMLPPLPGHFGTTAVGINNAGQIIGTSNPGCFECHQAVVWEYDGAVWQPTPIANPGLSYGYDINDAGQAVGFNATDFCPFDEHLPWREPGGLLPTLDGPPAEAYALNAAGEAVGTSDLSRFNCYQYSDAVMWTARGAIVSLGTLGGDNAEGRAINNLTQVVGSSELPDDCCAEHAFVWLPEPALGYAAGMNDLGTCGGGFSQALAINDAGLIVGRASYAQGIIHAVMWAGEELYDLNDMVPPDRSRRLTEAVAINASGQIVALGNVDGAIRSFLLLPRQPDFNANGIPDACEPSCPTVCGDADADGIRDDPCMFYYCAAGTCMADPRTSQADMGGFAGTCLFDGTCDQNDAFHARNCFADTDTNGQVPYPCEGDSPSAINVDAVGFEGVCEPTASATSMMSWPRGTALPTRMFMGRRRSPAAAPIRRRCDRRRRGATPTLPARSTWSCAPATAMTAWRPARVCRSTCSSAMRCRHCAGTSCTSAAPAGRAAGSS